MAPKRPLDTENASASGKQTTRDWKDIVLPGEEEGELEYNINCDAIRRKINSFLNSGEMKVTKFQRTIDANSNSYGRFMKLKGAWSGIDNQTMHGAYKFFEKRRIAGITEPKPGAKRQKTSDSSSTYDQDVDISSTHLDGEDKDEVPIFDSCDELRRKINAYLRTGTTTAAAFLRSLSTMLVQPKPIQSKQLKDFLTKKGATSGAASIVYYTAYVYFEKRRVKEGKPKTKHRLTMEDIHGMDQGATRKEARALWVHDSEIPVEDEYGRVTFQKK